MVSRIHWKDPLPGDRATTNVVTCHWHHYSAKMHKGGGFREAHYRFLKLLAWAIHQFQPEILTGDFNMGLLVIADAMRRESIHINIVSWYAWRGIRAGGGIAEDEPDPASQPPDDETELNIDSCAIFVC